MAESKRPLIFEGGTTSRITALHKAKKDKEIKKRVESANMPGSTRRSVGFLTDRHQHE